MLCFVQKIYIPLRGSQESVGSLNPRIFPDLDQFMAYDNVDIPNDRKESVPYLFHEI